jgi:hypothetical protein
MELRGHDISGPVYGNWYGNVEGARFILDERPRIDAAAYVQGYGQYVCTSLVTKILEDTPEYMRFKTLNSIYDWWYDEDN